MISKYFLSHIFIFLILLLSPLLAHAENIDPDNDGSQYAWGENVGWINLEPGGNGGQGVTVSSTQLTGYAWGENIGWINFSPASGGVVNDGHGNLSGYAWAENVGWINFNPSVGTVTAGNEPADWPYWPEDVTTGNRLYIDYTNPADADGTIETFQMYVSAGSGNIYIFTGTWDGINTIVPRAVATVAVQGTYQINTWTGLNLAVQTGDVLGFYGSNLQINRNLNTGTGNYAYTNLNPGIPSAGIPINTNGTGTRKMAVYATGGDGVAINPNTGRFSGYAWGENIGWINFSPAAGGGVRTAWLDADGDSYGTDVDCDDNDPDRFPGNPEVCDQKDNDCDGYVNNGLLNCYILSYIDEDYSFELPLGWTIIDNAGTSAVWRFDDPGYRSNLTGGSGIFAIADSDYFGFVNMDTELRTQGMDLSNLNNVTLEFSIDFNSYSGSEIADVDISINGASGPWTNIWKNNVGYRGPRTELIDITSIAAGESNVMLRFHYYNANYDWWWQIDDVRLAGTAGGSCAPSVRIDGNPAMYYILVQDAYDAAWAGNTIQCQDAVNVEDLYIDVNKTVFIEGGFNCSYSGNAGVTTINGNMTISDGILTIQSGKVKIQ